MPRPGPGPLTSQKVPAALVGSPPANTVAPVVSGTPTQGQTLSVTNGTWTNSPTGYSYQWKRDGANIPGAIVAAYLLTLSDVAAMITCVVTASNGGGAASQVSNAVGPVASLAVPSGSAMKKRDGGYMRKRDGGFMLLRAVGVPPGAMYDPFGDPVIDPWSQYVLEP